MRQILSKCLENDMVPLQLLFVLECNDEDKSDAIYLNEVISHFYVFESENYSQVSRKSIFLKGKGKYKNYKDYINNVVSMFSHEGGVTKVIYMIDLDSTDKEYKSGSLNYNIMDYCNRNNYDLIWMCKNVENVFLGVEPDAIENKTEAAKQFARLKNKEFDNIKLSKTTIELYCSNILIILDKYLKRK